MLSVEGVVVRYGEVAALAGLDLEVADGEVVALLGPSGSGKSTLLRVVAGLVAPDAGSVTWDGQDLAGVPPHRRGFGLMFQDYALFPHLDVGGNVAFGLRMQGPVRPGRVAEVLEMVGLPGYEDRAVGTLSGGEAQRVALARALAPEPRMLMLDEPVGSLDRVLRERLVIELRELLVRLRMTALYVTHDQEEGFSVADRVAVLRDGQVVASGAPEELWSRPADAWTARFLGQSNVVEGVVAAGVAATPWGELPVPEGTADGPATLVVRADALRVADDGAISGVVEAATFRGDHVRLRVRPDAGPPLDAEVERRAPPGERVSLAVDPEGVVVLGKP